MKKLIIVFAVLLMLSVTGMAQPARLPTDFSTTLFADVPGSPTAMAFAPDGRLFVLEQTGAVRVINPDGTLLAAPFTTFTVDSNGERGLLGIAFHPNFNANQYVYFYYTQNNSGTSRNRVVRLTANGNTAVPGSAVQIVQLPVLSTATNHNGGAIHFGLDGKLYVAVGENANAPLAQSMTTRFGKLLRYNADGSIPTDNPFYNTASGQNRSIWALGLRNPYTFAVQPVTGTIYINDVGGGSFEEINVGSAGGNYGWPVHEGPSASAGYLLPLYAYDHSANNCAITGGAFYNPANALYPASYTGDYFFADFCQNEVRILESGGGVTVFDNTTSGDNIVDLQLGPDGKLYYLARNPSAVFRYEYDSGPTEGELVRNGSFETDANSDNVPDNWVNKGGAARVCGGGQATDGVCVMRLKSAGAVAKIQQKINAASMVSGTSLALSATVSGKNVQAGAVLRLKVQTANGTTTHNVPVPTGTYTAQDIALLTNIVTDGQGIKLTVSMVYPALGGKVFFDEVSVFATPPLR